MTPREIIFSAQVSSRRSRKPTEDPQFQACLREGAKDEDRCDRCVGQEA